MSRTTKTAEDGDIVFTNVSKSFGEVQAVKELSLRLPQGQIYGFLGPNGAGKTTCLRMLLSIILPDQGEIHLQGGATAWDLRDQIGYLPEERGLYRRMQVMDHLKFLAEIKGADVKAVEPRILKWLERLGLADRAKSKVMDLSKGNQQKVQFIGTLAHNPSLLVLDEVFSGLDPINQQQIRDILLELRKEGKTIIFSTHIMEQAEQLCDGICLIHRGQCIMEGALDELKAEHGKGKLQLEHTGSVDFLQAKDYILSYRTTGNNTELQLKEDADPNLVLTALLDKDIKIQRFELANPTLKELFMQKVESSEENTEGDTTDA